mmetsp:Transcript_6077/g.6608  ORF Transcript_6077/g.6608 Transcript_6077/m.6608 type:complete len:442 (-) Transcript_6077:360-1685(-)
MVTVKGNSGKGARNRLIQRLVTVIAICLILIAVCEFSGNGRYASISKTIKKKKDKIINHNHENREHRFHRGNSKLSQEEKIDLIVSGKVHLIDIIVTRPQIRNSKEGTYEGVIGKFCEIEWSAHKSNPSKFPMFKDLMDISKDCRYPFEYDLLEAVNQVKRYENSDEYPSSHSLQPNGFVFHESRCGSTLAANALAAMEPSMSRVYSESPPPITALKACGLGGEECARGTVTKLVRDVFYMMGRTNDVNEEYLFFKIQSIGTKYIDVALEAFPDTPWIFIYREPVQVMMSQLSMGANRANCVRQLRDVPDHVLKYIKKIGMDFDDLDNVDKCAVHLGLLCESAYVALSEDSSYGVAVNYEDIVNKLISTVIPDHFDVEMTDERSENILAVSSRYSKGRGDRSKEWKEDSSKKERGATPEIRSASRNFLNKLYERLEEIAVE